VQQGETVVVPGIGSGVATFVVQMAASLGARVFVTSGSEEKIEKAKELGAEGGVNYNNEDWSKELKGMAGGVDLSVDHVGGEAFDALVSLAAPGGRIVTFGATAGPKVTVVMPRIFLKHLTVLGTAMGTPEEFGAMLDLYAEHGLRPVVNETFPLEEATAAMGHMEEGAGIGKIVLDVPA
jgi:NADPH:quinone reductase-like Zn-dependent oxidoreductase